MSSSSSRSQSGDVNFSDPNAAKSAWIPWAAVVAVVLLLAFALKGKS